MAKPWTYDALIRKINDEVDLAWALDENKSRLTVWLSGEVSELLLHRVRSAYVNQGWDCYILKSADRYGVELHRKEKT